MIYIVSIDHQPDIQAGKHCAWYWGANCVPDYLEILED